MAISKTGVFGGWKTVVAAAAAAVLSMGAHAGTSAAAAGSEGVDVGSKAPNFTLVDIEGASHTLSEYVEDGKIVVLEWYNPGCPFVKKHYAKADSRTMNTVHKEFKDDGVVWLRINSGAPGKQGHGLEMNKKMAKEWDLTGPVLVDESGKVGKMFGAKRTPEMFIVGPDGKVHYHGAIDDNKSAKLKGGEKNFVRQALREILAGETVTNAQTKPYGCSVKYAG
ncbi:MAG: thioredoxin family protein [Planctomycetota bacterium]